MLEKCYSCQPPIKNILRFDPQTKQTMLGPAQLLHTAVEGNFDFARAAEKAVETRKLPREERARAAVSKQVRNSKWVANS